MLYQGMPLQIREAIMKTQKARLEEIETKIQAVDVAPRVRLPQPGDTLPVELREVDLKKQPEMIILDI